MGRKRRFCFAVEKKITEREGWKWMEGGMWHGIERSSERLKKTGEVREGGGPVGKGR